MESLILTDLTGDGIVLRAHEEHYDKYWMEWESLIQSPKILCKVQQTTLFSLWRFLEMLFCSSWYYLKYVHLSWTTTSVQHPLEWCDGYHRTTVPVRSPHTSYRWRGERDIEPIKCMLSPHTSYRWRGERVIEPIKCMRSPHTSYRWRGERVIETIKCMRSPHTSYRWRGERVIETIKCMRSPHTSYRWRGERET